MAVGKASPDHGLHGAEKCRADLERTVDMFLKAVGAVAPSLRRRIGRNVQAACSSGPLKADGVPSGPPDCPPEK